MRLYRICHVRYLEDLRGLGASYRDGARWNEPGFPIVYFAETPSVAMLEMAHFLPSPRLVPPGYRLGVYEVSDEVALERWHVHDLPEGWDRYPHPRSTRRMGTLRVIACIETPEVIERNLAHLATRETGAIHDPRAPPLGVGAAQPRPAHH